MAIVCPELFNLRNVACKPKQSDTNRSTRLVNKLTLECDIRCATQTARMKRNLNSCWRCMHSNSVSGPDIPLLLSPASASCQGTTLRFRLLVHLCSSSQSSLLMNDPRWPSLQLPSFPPSLSLPRSFSHSLSIPPPSLSDTPLVAPSLSYMCLSVLTLRMTADWRSLRCSAS